MRKEGHELQPHLSEMQLGWKESQSDADLLGPRWRCRALRWDRAIGTAPFLSALHFLSCCYCSYHHPVPFTKPNCSFLAVEFSVFRLLSAHPSGES